MKKLLCAIVLTAIAAQANAASITYSSSVRPTTAEEIGGGAPVGDVYSFFVTTDADILSVFAFKADTTVAPYKHPSAATNQAADPVFVGVFPAMGASSYVDTPGDGGATVLGVAFPGDGTNGTSYGDTSTDPPATNFQFAQITVPTGTTGNFFGQVAIAGGFSNSFDFPIGNVIPEPATFAMAGMGLVGMIAVARRRRK